MFVDGNINGTLSVIDSEATVDIFDILTLTEIILEGNGSGCGYEISDLSQDGNVNVLDVISLVTFILYGPWS